MMLPTFNFSAFQPYQSWTLFVFLAIIIIVVSYFLPRLVLDIFKKTYISLFMIGFFLLSFLTSLPEFLSTIFSVLSNKNRVDGFTQSFNNIIGANFFSATTLIVLDLIFFRYYYLNKTNFNNLLTILFVVCYNFIFLLLLIVPGLEWTINGFSITALFLIICYFLIALLLARSPKITYLQVKPEINEKKYFSFHINSVILILVVIISISVLVFVFAIFSNLAIHLKNHYQIAPQSIGGIFFAITTAFPELLAAISLFRLRLASTALAVVFGSHLINMVLFLISNLIFMSPAFTILQTNISNLSIMLLTFFSSSLFLIHVLCHHPKQHPLYFPFPLLILLIFIVGWIKIL